MSNMIMDPLYNFDYCQSVEMILYYRLRTGQQKDSLMKVFTWFKANKHTLHSGPVSTQ